MAWLSILLMLTKPTQTLQFLHPQKSNCSLLANLSRSPQTLFFQNPDPRPSKMIFSSVKAQAEGNPVGPGFTTQLAIYPSQQFGDLCFRFSFYDHWLVFIGHWSCLLAWYPHVEGLWAIWFYSCCHIFHYYTAATKLKMAQKEAQGVAEKKKGRRGPGSVIGSSATGCVCAFLSIYGIDGRAFSLLWELVFVASFCTKLSDTVSSEIGKAYGRTTYLVTTFKVVPRETEGAVWRDPSQEFSLQFFLLLLVV